MNRPVFARNWKVDKALPVGETNNERRKVSPRFSSFTGSEMKNLLNHVPAETFFKRLSHRASENEGLRPMVI
jgi:hypothetical protein